MGEWEPGMGAEGMRVRSAWGEAVEPTYNANGVTKTNNERGSDASTAGITSPGPTGLELGARPLMRVTNKLWSKYDQQ